ncbi:MAG: cytochrome c3 family protein [Acidobacteria bacterium]|nr:cytochrome c3 family protein [Acidobacteriota bacterium]
MSLVALAEQPIPYSHKTHLKLGLKCAECHTLPGKGEAAGYPPESKCMACHAQVKRDSAAIGKLAGYFQLKKPVPWQQIYRLPDYVWFSHKRHSKSACETCHGPVAERDVIVKEKAITMVACMACHEDTSAPNECNSCHNP